MQRYDDEGAFMFVDPPYPSTTVRTKRSPYSLEYNDNLHEKLIEFALTAKSKIMLASYPNPLYDTLLNKGWVRIDKQKIITIGVTTKQILNKRNGQNIKPIRTESLYLNYTPPNRLT